MAIAPVTPQSAALQQAVAGAGPIAPPTGQMGGGSLSNADWLAKMRPGSVPANMPIDSQTVMSPTTQTPSAGASYTPPERGAMKSSSPPSYAGGQQQMQQQQMQQQQMQEQMAAQPVYQEQTYGGGESYGKGMYGEDRVTPETSYRRLPGNDSVYATDGAGYKNPFLGNDRFGNAQAGTAGARPWETSAEARAANAAAGGGAAAAAGGQGYADPNNTTDEFITVSTGFMGDIQVPNPYYGSEGGDGEGGDDAPVDANNDGRIDDAEYNSWRPEDARFGRGHGGRALSQANLDHLATFGVLPGADGKITDAQFAEWANENDNRGGDYGGAGAAYADTSEGSYDRDGNGVLNATELASYQTELRKKAIQARMAKGMTEKEANANLDSAISQGGDANQDGVVTDAEWSAFLKTKNG